MNKSDFSRTASKSLIKYEKEEFSNTLSNKRLGQASCGNSKSISVPEKSKNLTALERGNHNFIGESWDPHRKLQRKQSEVLDSTKEKLNTNLSNKKPSEIPKLKPLAKGTSGIISQKIIKGPSKLPVKTKDFDDRQSDSNPETCKSKPESVRMALKSYRVKREAKLDEKIKEAMKDEFAFLIPLYESEFRKITEVWVNTLYCSLTMRTNLVKLLYQAFPQINRGQFQTEDETLLHYITHAKNHTKCEADNLLQFIRSLQGNRERAKEQYTSGMANREIAQIYNHDWKTLTRKISELGEESKQLQMEVPELQKKKAVFESTQNDKIREMQGDIEKKEQQLRKLTSQLNVLKEKEASYKKNVFLKIQDYNDIKADVSSLKSTEKEFEDLKATFLCQSEMYEKKIKEMEILLEEKKKVLEKEKEVKQKLQVFLNHLQSLSLGKEQVDYVLGRPNNSREKRREQLWLAAVQLVLRGMKNMLSSNFF